MTAKQFSYMRKRTQNIMIHSSSIGVSVLTNGNAQILRGKFKNEQEERVRITANSCILHWEESCSRIQWWLCIERNVTSSLTRRRKRVRTLANSCIMKLSIRMSVSKKSCSAESEEAKQIQENMRYGPRKVTLTFKPTSITLIIPSLGLPAGQAVAGQNANQLLDVQRLTLETGNCERWLPGRRQECICANLRMPTEPDQPEHSRTK